MVDGANDVVAGGGRSPISHVSPLVRTMSAARPPSNAPAIVAVPSHPLRTTNVPTKASIIHRVFRASAHSAMNFRRPGTAPSLGRQNTNGLFSGPWRAPMRPSGGGGRTAPPRSAGSSTSARDDPRRRRWSRERRIELCLESLARACAYGFVEYEPVLPSKSVTLVR